MSGLREGARSELQHSHARTTQAREATSAPILQELGFESLYTSCVYQWEP